MLKKYKSKQKELNETSKLSWDRMLKNISNGIVNNFEICSAMELCNMRDYLWIEELNRKNEEEAKKLELKSSGKIDIYMLDKYQNSLNKKKRKTCLPNSQ